MELPAEAQFSPWCSSAGKRAFDIIVASLALAITWPVLLLVAAAIRLGSPGPVLFRQKRVGRNGRLFELLKFRSMRSTAGDSSSGITCSTDPRILPLGRVLRRWKLDELPQIFNVLRGEMSVVGPRPDLPEFCDTLRENQRRILELRPGITGAATLAYRHEEQILARQASRMKEYYVTELYPDKVRIDLEYAANAGFAGDVRILARTINAIFT